MTDPDGTVTGPSWQWARGDTATGSFSNINAATSASYTPVVADVGKYLRAMVSYTDPQGSGKSASEVSSSTVGGTNSAPTFDDGAMATRTLPENSGAGVDVVGGVVAATDSDSGDTLTYSLSGTDAARFEIDSSGQIKVKTGSTHTFDFEGAKKSYSVTVNVRDSKDALGSVDTAVDDTITVTIDLTNVNEMPMIRSVSTTLDVAENSRVVVTAGALDEDASTTLTWSIESTADGGKFEFHVATGPSVVLRFKDAPDFETPIDVGDTAGNNTYVVTVSVTDNGSPAMSDTHTYTVTVTNVNEVPEITNPETTVRKNENEAVVILATASDVDASDTLRWSVETSVDGGKFKINATTGTFTSLSFRNRCKNG